MMSLKNLLNKATSAPVAEAARKNQEPHGEMTGKTVKELAAAVDVATIALKQAKNAEGECWVDGRDATMAAEARRQAENRLHGLESALSVAKEKDAAALAARIQSETEFKRESLRALLTELDSVARKADTQMLAMGQTAAEAHRIIQRLHALGVGELNSRLMTVVGWFRIRLLDSCEQMPGCWTGQDIYGKREPWASHVPDPSEADRLVK